MSNKGISLRSSYFICHNSISIKKIWLYRLKPTCLTHTWKNTNKVAYTCHVNSEILCTRTYAQSRSKAVCYWKMVQKPWIIYRKSGRNSFLLLPGGLMSKIHTAVHLCLISKCSYTKHMACWQEWLQSEGGSIGWTNSLSFLTFFLDTLLCRNKT